MYLPFGVCTSSRLGRGGECLIFVLFGFEDDAIPPSPHRFIFLFLIPVAPPSQPDGDRPGLPAGRFLLLPQDPLPGLPLFGELNGRSKAKSSRGGENNTHIFLKNTSNLEKYSQTYIYSRVLPPIDLLLIAHIAPHSVLEL